MAQTCSELPRRVLDQGRKRFKLTNERVACCSLRGMTEDEMIAELARVAAERTRLVYELAKVDARRDQLVRDLMHTSAARDEITKASGLKIARLYQIRDGRR